MRAVRILGWMFSAAAMLMLGAVVALWLGGAPLATRIAVRVAAANGWQLEFSEIDLTWGDFVTLVVGNIKMARTGAQDEAAASFRADRLEAHFNPKALLLRLAVRVHGLSIQRPVIVVETQARPKTSHDGLTTAFSELRFLELRDGTIEYRNLSAGAETKVEIVEARADAADGDPRLVITGRGEFEGKPFRVGRAELSRELLASGRRHGPAREVALEGWLGANKIALTGTLHHFEKLEGLDVQVDMAGEDLQQVLAALAVPIPRMPIYLLAGRLQHDVGRWRIDNITGRIGDSRIAGLIHVDSPESSPPYVRAELTSDELHLRDLRGFYGGEIQAARSSSASHRTAAAKNGRVIPDLKLPLERLIGFAADISLDAARVKVPGWGINKLAFALSVKDGDLRLERLRVGTAEGGELNGDATLRAAGGPPELSLGISARGIRLRPLLAGADLPPGLKELGGVLSGSAKLRSTGATQRQLLARLEGGVELLLQHAQLTRSMARTLESDVGEAIEKMFGGGGKSEAAQQGDGGRVNCFIGTFQVAGGIATATNMLVNTPETIVLGRGNLNMADETILLELRPYAKDQSRRPVGAPLHLTGTFANPEVTADKAGFVARLGAALGLGAVEVSPELKALLGAEGNTVCAAAISGSSGEPSPTTGHGRSRAAPPR